MAAGVLYFWGCGGGAPPGQPQSPQPPGPDQTVPQCVPTTCAAARAACGTIPDGCGLTLSCGGCASGQACGGGGVPNACGAGGPVRGDLRWVTATPQPVLSISSDRSGAAAILYGDESGRTIARYDAAGKVLWSRSVSIGADQITMDASGAIFILGFAEHARGGPKIDRLSRDGASVTNLVPEGSDEGGFSRVSVNARGDWVYTRNIRGLDSTIALHRADGAVVFLTEREDLPLFFEAVALDDSGNVAAAAYVRSELTFGGKTWRQGMALMKLSPDLEILWIQQLPQSGHIRTVATTRLGTVVALGYFDDRIAWGGATFYGGAVVFVAEADGTPRFFRGLPPALRGDSWRLAVDPAGKMTLGATMPGCSGAMLEEINLAGDELWNRLLTSDACDATVEDVGTLAGSALAGGHFGGSVDFGKGPVFSGAGYLVDYAD